ncbi:hypothetical protein C8J57DRAFT_1502655 [Mycena rebaudengoi]|nr:hypothetical protein C8J57DRAFT_1502655 [Mycena rebaudengoi]
MDPLVLVWTDGIIHRLALASSSSLGIACRHSPYSLLSHPFDGGASRAATGRGIPRLRHESRTADNRVDEQEGEQGWYKDPSSMLIHRYSAVLGHRALILPASISTSLRSSIMGDLEKGTPVEVENNTDEAAAAKLWAVYVSEAEKYDKALVESWKSDMGGMLIFEGQIEIERKQPTVCAQQ